jgi:D-lactate dehydrogenase (cytochrome)
MSRDDGDVSRDGPVRIKTGSGDIVFPLPDYPWPDTKSSAGIYSKKGMDLVDLFVGSEGILGVISALEVRLVPEPQNVFGIVAFFPEDRFALEFIRAARGSGDVEPLCLELFDSRSLELLRDAAAGDGNPAHPPIPGHKGYAAVYFEQAYGTEDEMERLFERWSGLLEANHSSMDDTWGGLDTEDRQRLHTFRHALPETVNDIISRRRQDESRIHKVASDMAVPDDRFEDVFWMYREDLEGDGMEHVIFGHAGDNHFHVNVLPRSHQELQRAKCLFASWARKVVSWGGSVSAEHGIGRLKKDYLLLQVGDAGLASIRTIKRAMDPGWILNPGVMVDPN